MKVLSFVLVLKFNVFKITSAIDSQIFCEKIEPTSWRLIRSQNTCFMTSTTKINSPGLTISSAKDEDVTGLDFDKNKKVSYLPDKVYLNFPNLIGYSARECSIEIISRENFYGLVNVKVLSLNKNQIEKIHSDTFVDLISLEVLALGNNKIKFLNGEVIFGLTNLKTVDLESNQCIFRNFRNETEIAALPKRLTKNCGFYEILEDCQTQSETILKLQSELNAAKSATARVKNLLDFTQNVCLQLDAQRNVSFSELRRTAEFKTREVEDLLLIVQSQNEIINTKNEEIKKLQEQINVLPNVQ